MKGPIVNDDICRPEKGISVINFPLKTSSEVSFKPDSVTDISNKDFSDEAQKIVCSMYDVLLNGQYLILTKVDWKSHWLKVENYIIGFFIGLVLNIMGFGYTKNTTGRRQKQVGFFAGCIVSFVIFVFICITSAGYLNQVQREQKSYLKTHKRSLKGFKVTSFQTYMSNLGHRVGQKIKHTILFWRSEDVVHNKVISKREQETIVLKKKRLNTIHRLRKSFDAKYNF